MRSKAINRALLLLSFVFGLFQFYWWLLVPPLLTAMLGCMGLLMMPAHLRKQSKVPFEHALLAGAFTIGLGSAICFALGWLTRLTGNWVMGLVAS